MEIVAKRLVRDYENTTAELSGNPSYVWVPCLIDTRPGNVVGVASSVDGKNVFVEFKTGSVWRVNISFQMYNQLRLALN